MLSGRHIVLGVSGGVAAYKAAYLARRLVESGAEVKAVMTPSAVEFLGPQTLAAICGVEPLLDLFGQSDVSPHTTLGRWADAVVIAPATAATLSRLANGLSEGALAATVLATDAPLLVAPAMHTEMWQHPATQRSVATLADDGCAFVGPVSGALAGGDVGLGRMAEPDDIVAALASLLAGDLEGWRVLVSAGGTREPIDPVRYIGNRSSGKMGNALAVAAARRGAEVTLVTSATPPEVAGVRVVVVETAEQMATAVWSVAEHTDVAVLAAAVADFRPAGMAAGKLRRAEGPPQIVLEPTPDILAGVAAMEPRPFLVGFAAETGSLAAAVDKARRKGVDLLVGNDVSRTGSGFGTATNEVTLITPDGVTDAWPLLTKDEVADRLWDEVRRMRTERGDSR